MNFKDHIVKASEIAVEHFDHYAKIGGLGSNFSKHFNLKRVGVHHFVISPGFRTSRPHAESIEEEFVFVIKGEIDLWFNGKIKKMTEFSIFSTSSHNHFSTAPDQSLENLMDSWNFAELLRSLQQ